MKEKCEASCLKVGDNTYFGKVEKIFVYREETSIWFDNGLIEEFGNSTEITFWE